MNTTTTTPQVWAGCLAAYNDGDLHGEWMDATDVDELRESIKNMLASSPVPNAEEWHFCDFEGFGEIPLGRYESLETICAYGALIDEHGDAAQAFIQDQPDYWAGNLDDLPAALEDANPQEFDTAADFAMEFMDSIGAEPADDSPLVIDWNATGEQLLMDYTRQTVNGTTYVWLSA
jgi:antirestriction protein